MSGRSFGILVAWDIPRDLAIAEDDHARAPLAARVLLTSARTSDLEQSTELGDDTLGFRATFTSVLAYVFSVARTAAEDGRLASLRIALHVTNAATGFGGEAEITRVRAALRDARPGEIVATGAFAPHARTVPFARVVARPRSTSFTVGMIRPETVRVTDPICGKTLERSNVRFRILREREVFYFCSRLCENEFRRRGRARGRGET